MGYGAKPRPNDKNTGTASPACAAIPEWQNAETFYFCTRRWQSVCQLAHARTVSARRTHFLSALSYFIPQ